MDIHTALSSPWHFYGSSPLGFHTKHNISQSSIKNGLRMQKKRIRCGLRAKSGDYWFGRKMHTEFLLFLISSNYGMFNGLLSIPEKFWITFNFVNDNGGMLNS